jgi:hypothetical protein
MLFDLKKKSYAFQAFFWSILITIVIDYQMFPL